MLYLTNHINIYKTFSIILTDKKVKFVMKNKINSILYLQLDAMITPFLIHKANKLSIHYIICSVGWFKSKDDPYLMDI